MGQVEDRIVALGLAVPEAFKFPNANRTGCVRVGDLLFVSGHGPATIEGIHTAGKVGGAVSEEEGAKTARACALSMLASIKAEIGDLDKITKVVELLGMVNSAPGFNRQFAVIDGASDFFVEVFGQEAGQHARAAVGMAELPRDIPVEIKGVFTVGD